MNVNLNQEPLVKLRGFNGLWARGADSSCPIDHLTECYNCSFPGPGQISIRENYTIQNDIAGRSIISFAVATLAGGPILLSLNADGTLYDETHATLLGTFAGADDFSALSIYGRCYITLKTKGRAYSGGNLYWYDGVTFHTAGWAAPSGTVTLAQINAGLVTSGLHRVAVAFESSTGALSKPSPITSINSDGTHTISISGIPVGPPGTIGRRILVSKANRTELFFDPDGAINDNTTTTHEFTSTDLALLDSADYLNDLIYPIPSCAALKFYKGRLVMIGRDSFPDLILVSRQTDPEAFDLVNGVVNLPVDYGYNTATSGMVIREVLYITKPNSTYATQDNGNEPGTWGVSAVDTGLGAFDNAISVFASSMSAQDTLDSCLIAHRRGLLLFTGTYPDAPLTYKIERLWQLIDQNSIHQIQIAHDIWNKRVYIAVPLQPAGTRGQRITPDPGGNNNIILMMDYQEGMNPTAVKWSVWSFAGPFKKIGVENFLLNYTSTPIIYQLAIARGDQRILKIVAGTAPGIPDTGSLGALTAINQYIITAPIAPGGIVSFTGLRIYFDSGNKKIIPSIFSKSRVGLGTDKPGFALDQYDPAVELFRGINFQSTGMEVCLYAEASLSGGTQAYYNLTGLDIYGKVMYERIPDIQENL